MAVSLARTLSILKMSWASVHRSADKKIGWIMGYNWQSSTTMYNHDMPSGEQVGQVAKEACLPEAKEQHHCKVVVRISCAALCPEVPDGWEHRRQHQEADCHGLWRR